MSRQENFFDTSYGNLAYFYMGILYNYINNYPIYYNYIFIFFLLRSFSLIKEKRPTMYLWNLSYLLPFILYSENKNFFLIIYFTYLTISIFLFILDEQFNITHKLKDLMPQIIKNFLIYPIDQIFDTVTYFPFMIILMFGIKFNLKINLYNQYSWVYPIFVCITPIGYLISFFTGLGLLFVNDIFLLYPYIFLAFNEINKIKNI